jgi:hypothetical protein
MIGMMGMNSGEVYTFGFVYTGVTMKNMVTLGNLVEVCHHFGVAYCLHIQS